MDVLLKNFDGALWRQARARAAVFGVTAKKLTEDALRAYLVNHPEPEETDHAFGSARDYVPPDGQGR